MTLYANYINSFNKQDIAKFFLIALELKESRELKIVLAMRSALSNMHGKYVDFLSEKKWFENITEDGTKMVDEDGILDSRLKVKEEYIQEFSERLEKMNAEYLRELKNENIHVIDSKRLKDMVIGEFLIYYLLTDNRHRYDVDSVRHYSRWAFNISILNDKRILTCILRKSFKVLASHKPYMDETKSKLDIDDDIIMYVYEDKFCKTGIIKLNDQLYFGPKWDNKQVVFIGMHVDDLFMFKNNRVILKDLK